MTNPAADLLEVIDQWTARLEAAGGVPLRETLGANDTQSAEQYARAMAAIAGIAKCFDTYADEGRTEVAHLFETFPTWIRMVTAQGHDWTGRATAKSLYPPNAMSDLRSLRAIINADDRLLPNDSIAELRDRVSAVRATLDDDETLPELVRRTLETLLREFEAVLDAKPTEDDVRAAWEQVAVTLIAAEATSTKSTSWRGTARRWGSDIVTQVIAGIGSGLVTQAITGA